MKHLSLIAALLVMSAGSVCAQTPQATKVVGSIEHVDGGTLTIKPMDGGAPVAVKLTDKAAVFGVNKATLADLKTGAFIGVGAMPQSDGSQRAIQVTVFAESQRGLGEGFRPWDRRPNSTMTNATVAETVGGVDGQVLTVKYKDGEKKIVVPQDAVILAYSIADKSELKPGAHIAILRATRSADGSLETNRVNVGRGDVVPR
jgi:hypothetical protein